MRSRLMNGRAVAAATAALAAVALLLALGAVPAAAGTWALGMTVHNKTPYELRYKTTHAKNVDKWIQAPDIPESAATIAPGADSVAIKYQQNTPFGDTWARVVWDVRRVVGGNSVSVGELSYEVKVICNVGCAFDYSRSTTATVTPGDLVGLSWKDNGKTPGAGYYGELTVSPKARGVAAPAAPPVLGSCAPRGIRLGRGAPRIETADLGCRAALRAIKAGSTRGGNWTTSGWECAKVGGRGERGRVRCERAGGAFTFRPARA